MGGIKDKLIKNYTQYRAIEKKSGPGPAIYCMLYDLINKVTPFSVYRVTLMRAQDIPRALYEIPQRFCWRRLAAEESLRYAQDPANDMSIPFVRDALAHGEECYGLFDSDRLASYAWYSGSPSHARHDVFFFFDGNHKYRHKAFTYPAYRGCHLNVYNKALACRHYSEMGYNGLLSIVEAHNISSLRSNRRVGSVIVGDIAVLMLAKRYRIIADAGSRAFGCKLEAAAPAHRGQDE